MYARGAFVPRAIKWMYTNSLSIMICDLYSVGFFSLSSAYFSKRMEWAIARPYEHVLQVAEIVFSAYRFWMGKSNFFPFPIRHICSQRANKSKREKWCVSQIFSASCFVYATPGSDWIFIVLLRAHGARDRLPNCYVFIRISEIQWTNIVKPFFFSSVYCYWCANMNDSNTNRSEHLSSIHWRTRHFTHDVGAIWLVRVLYSTLRHSFVPNGFIKILFDYAICYGLHAMHY